MTDRINLELWIASYLRDELSEEETQEFESFLDNNPEIRHEVKGLKETWSLLHRITPEESEFEELDTQFYRKLDEKKDTAQHFKQEATHSGLMLGWLKIAAILILVAGASYVLVGIFSAKHVRGKTDLVSDKTLPDSFITIFSRGSASERLKAIDDTYRLKGAGDRIISILDSTLNNDNNVNVRLAAIDALVHLADHKKARIALVNSLTLQKLTVIQFALLDACGVLKEKTAIPPIEFLLNSGSTDEEIKKKAATTLETMKST